jgi:hypothetical protein
MRSLGLAVALSIAAGAAFGQTRPLLTEQAETAPAGSLVLETGADFIHGEPSFVNGAERDRWDAPGVRLVYSPSGNVELDLEWVARIIASGPAGSAAVSDWGDVTLRSKVRFAEERPGRPAFGARFGVTLPETHSRDGLGPNTLRMFAQFLLSKTWAGTRLDADLGLALHDRPFMPHAQSDFIAYGLALVRAVGPRLALVGEVSGLAGEGDPGADEHAELRVGLRYGAGRVRGDAAARRGLTRHDGRWGFTAGVSWTLRGR